MSVSIEQIKELRESTGVSMMACKKALEEADGDYDKAVDILRKKGEAKAADRSERGTSQGVVVIKSEGGRAAMVELLCETDFVARGDDFVALAETLAAKLLSAEISSKDDEVPAVKDAVLKLGENIQLSNAVVYEGENVGSYVHSNGKIGVLVNLDGGDSELARDVAMHAAATAPSVISPDEVPDELVDKEKVIWTDQLRSEGKPEEIMEKIMIGKEKKFREENALLKQPFVKNPDQTIEQILNGVNVKEFTRFAI